MNIISAPRAGGKTTRAVEMVREKNGLLICNSERQAHQVRVHFGLSEDQCLSWHRFRDRFRGDPIPQSVPVIWDNAIQALEDLIQHNIDGITVNE